jgi:anti-sigma factor RsiW
MRLRFGRRPLACQQVVELLTEHLEGALPPRLATLVDQHLAGCPNCAAFLEQLRAAIALAGALAPVDVAEVPDDVVDALVDAFAEYHRDATGPPEEPTV